MLKNKIMIILAGMTTLLFLMSCETKDDNKMAGAQECLDALKDSDADSAALACENKIAGIETPEAYVIRCSVRFFVGGVKSSTLVNAFDDYEDAAENLKASVLMDALAQIDIPSAEATYEACKKSKVASLDYIATASLTGTVVKVGGGNTGDPIQDLQNCENGGAGGVCDDVAIGTAVVAMYDAYCIGDAAATQVCTEVRSAMDAVPSGDPAQIAIALYNLMSN